MPVANADCLWLSCQPSEVYSQKDTQGLIKDRGAALLAIVNLGPVLPGIVLVGAGFLEVETQFTAIPDTEPAGCVRTLENSCRPG